MTGVSKTWPDRTAINVGGKSGILVRREDRRDITGSTWTWWSKVITKRNDKQDSQQLARTRRKATRGFRETKEKKGAPGRPLKKLPDGELKNKDAPGREADLGRRTVKTGIRNTGEEVKKEKDEGSSGDRHVWLEDKGSGMKENICVGARSG